jgi:hypothetical protein
MRSRPFGYDGSYSVVRNYLDKGRPEKAPLGEAPPTVRDVTNWLCRRPDDLTEDERPKLKAILLIKCQMFGRASLPLLRKRVLLTAQS